jgi:hypothetical protein
MRGSLEHGRVNEMVSVHLKDHTNAQDRPVRGPSSPVSEIEIGRSQDRDFRAEVTQVNEYMN